MLPLVGIYSVAEPICRGWMGILKTRIYICCHGLEFSNVHLKPFFEFSFSSYLFNQHFYYVLSFSMFYSKILFLLPPVADFCLCSLRQPVGKIFFRYFGMSCFLFIPIVLSDLYVVFFLGTFLFEASLFVLLVSFTTQVLYFCIFTNPSARAGYDTRSIFKRSLTGLNSEFFFS